VGPVSFTATIGNVSATNASGSWEMQGEFTVTAVGNRNCTASVTGIPMTFQFTYR